MTKLHLASGLDLPIDVVTQKQAFLGRTGSGKTYGATKLAELLLDHDAQIVALDPVGVWYGLRIGADGGPGFSIPVLGGLHGDIPLEATAGALIADVVVDRGISAVLDVSQFETDAQKARFAAAFGERFFFRKKAAPSAVHIFLEECQEFVPQNPTGNEAEMLHFWTRLAKLGRNFGIGLSLISQRPQEINKKVLNMTEALFAFQMRGEQERKTIKAWSNEKALDVDVADELPSLAVGECFVSSPQWLQVEKRVRVHKKVTADVSSTPKVGAAPTSARELTPIDLAELQHSMTATIERAKADDPKALQKRIGELEVQLKQRQNGHAPDPAAVQRQVDAAVGAALAGERERARQVIERIEHGADALNTAERLYANAIGPLRERLQSALSIMRQAAKHPPAAQSVGVPSAVHASRVATVATAGKAVATAPARTDISGPQQRMLNALATMLELTSGDMRCVPRNVVAALSNQSPRSSGWDKNCSTLRTKGLISYPDSDTMALTSEAASIAVADASITSLADLHAAWKNLVSSPQWRMLEALIGVYPDAMDRNALAAQSGQSPSSSGWDKNLSTLRTLGVLDYPSSTEARATQYLFPPGLH